MHHGLGGEWTPLSLWPNRMGQYLDLSPMNSPLPVVACLHILLYFPISSFLSIRSSFGCVSVCLDNPSMCENANMSCFAESGRLCFTFRLKGLRANPAWHQAKLFTITNGSTTRPCVS